jgi:hypothetical protein
VLDCRALAIEKYIRNNVVPAIKRLPFELERKKRERYPLFVRRPFWSIGNCNLDSDQTIDSADDDELRICESPQQSPK